MELLCAAKLATLEYIGRFEGIRIQRIDAFDR